MESESYERIMTAVGRGVPDRVPWFCYCHTPALPWLRYYSWEKSTRDGEELAKAYIAFLHELDYKMDLLKVTAWKAGMALQWGRKDRFVDNHEYPENVDVPVKETEDWRKLKVLDPKKELKESIRAVSILSREIGRRTPFIWSVHSPMMQALHGVSTPDRVYADMKSHPDALKEGLETITQTCIEMARAVVDEGATGISYGIGGGGEFWSRLNKSQFEEYGLHYDKKILAAVKDAPILMFHPCGKWKEDPQKSCGLMESGWFRQYPVNTIRWYDRQHTPLPVGKKIYGDIFCIAGGVDEQRTLRKGTPQEVESQVKEAIESAAEGGGFILTPGCTVLADTPLENINAMGRAVEKYGRYKR